MARRALPAKKRLGELVQVYLRPTERDVLEGIAEASLEFSSMSAVLREGFVAGVEKRQPRWAQESGKE